MSKKMVVDYLLATWEHTWGKLDPGMVYMDIGNNFVRWQARDKSDTPIRGEYVDLDPEDASEMKQRLLDDLSMEINLELSGWMGSVLRIVLLPKSQ